MKMDKTGYYKSDDGRFFYFQKGRTVKGKVGADALFEISQPDIYAAHIRQEMPIELVSDLNCRAIGPAEVVNAFPIQKTREQRIEEAYKRFFAFANLSHPIACPPHRKLEIGESVRVGHLADCVIIAEHPQYPGLHAVEYTLVNHNYGNPTYSKGQIGVWYWPDIWKFNELKETSCVSVSLASLMSTLNTSVRSLDSIVHEYLYRDLRDDAPYQRGYVWTLQDKQRFVQSMLENRPTGLFVFVQDRTHRTNDYFVLDGKQRLSAVVEFFTSQFPLSDGVYFHELSAVLRNAFDDRLVNVATIDSSQVSQSQLCDIFLAINTGGVPQSEEHLTHVRQLRDTLANPAVSA